MRTYEVVYILDPALEESAVDEKLERFHGVATKPGGEVVAVDHWGNRQLAYPIEGHNTGYYVVSHVNAEPDSLPEFERVVKLDDEVLRYLVVVNEGEPISDQSILAPRPPSQREEEEDEDEDELEEDEDEGPPEFSGGRGRRRRHEGPAIRLLNYKDVATLSKFVTEQGKILPRRTTKVSAPFQRQLSSAVKRARYLALIPYVRDHEG
ncbi:MAG: 30S ribosomal protein S6 [Longimicrobiales bacterium]